MKTRRQGDRETGKTRFFVYVFTYLLVSAAAIACSPQVQLKGTDLNKQPAPGFQLNDSRGNPVSLSDFRGRVVVLTFLYTHCPDECPLIAEKMRQAADQLGDAMKQTAFVAVSIDPVNDTPVSIQKFLQDHRLEGRLQYLVGTQEQLAPVWSAYYMGVEPTSLRQNEFLVAHTSRVIVIDKAGNQRVNMDSDLETADLVSNVRTLVRE